MYALWEGNEDENEITLQECTRIQRLARAVDELVAWDFIMDEREIILTELEKTVAVAEREISQAEKSLGMQRRRCALLPVSPQDMDEGGGKRQPHAARGDNPELSALWSEHGNKFIEQYERHLTRYKRVWHELLEEVAVTSSNTTTTTTTTTASTNAVKNNTNKNDEVK
ncbi:hypothetical protein LSM04_001017 [Trypanosoma melophagium]|uniref:uncharacterized protein n=1 Tax=Trypanosoma melophagium TaxID=715481 RepID=UPI003519FD4E|nr:hypothetical protein LSM04_001017 [Trypanosoma melophagium]